MSGIEKWSTSAGSNNDASPDGFPEGMAPSGVNNAAREVMAAIRTWYEDAEWPIYGVNGHANGYSISYVSATVFKFASTDRTAIAPLGRRVKAGVGAGDIYGRITDVTLSASDTQVTVKWDSGTLDASLSYVALGVLNAENSSIPHVLKAVVATSSGTSHDFTIPAWAKRVTLLLAGVSTNGTSVLRMQIGDSGGIENAGYSGTAFNVTGGTTTQLASGFDGTVANADAIRHGRFVLELLDGSTNTWICNYGLARSEATATESGYGSKALTGTLTTVRLTTANGTDAFDAGSASVLVE